MKRVVVFALVLFLCQVVLAEERGWRSFNSRDDYDNRTAYNSPDSQDSNYNSDERRGDKQNKKRYTAEED